MKHCVVSYAGRCAGGYSAITSLRRDGVRQATIEMQPAARMIVQVRGSCNRAPTLDEKKAVNQWQRQVLRKSIAGPRAPG